MKWIVGVIVCTASFGLVEIRASADPTKDECFAASQSGQSLQRSGKLLDARKQLLICAAASCPDVVKADCTDHVNQIDRALPTIVFDAKDADGGDLSAVRVAVDGVEIADHLDGRPVPIDPGQHAFTFTMANRSPVQKSFVIVQGEKDRHEHIVLGVPAAVPPPAPLPSQPQPAPSSSPSAVPLHGDTGNPWTTRKTIAVVAGGVGLVGIGLGAAFGLSAGSDWSKAQSECNTSSTCSNRPASVTDRSAALNAATVSTVGFIAGGVLLAGGVTLFLTAPSKPDAPASSASMRVIPTAAPGGAGMMLTGTF